MAKKTTIPVTEPANPAPSLTPDALLALLAEVKALRAQVEAKPAIKTQSHLNELKAVAAFKKRGFGVLTPHTDILTFQKWVSLGMRPKEGEHSVPVANLRLFARSQCRPLTKEEAAGFKAKAAEKAAKASAKVVPITGQSASLLPVVELVPSEPAPKTRKAKVTPTDQPAA